MRVFYSPAYVAAGYAFETTRKAGWIAESLAADPIPGLELVAPPPAERRQLELIHDAQYLAAVETGEPLELAESQGFTWDPALWPAVLASSGGAAAAALAALAEGVAGSLSSGLHHARRTHGAGFCTLNGLVLAANAALAAGAGRVLILDLDAHCGGGTAALIEADPRVWLLDVSCNPFDQYADTSHARLVLVERASGYLSAIRDMLAEVDRRGQMFDLCLYNAGMDPHEDCPAGALEGITRNMLAERERLVFAWCVQRSLPVAFVLAGGYLGDRLDQSRLVELHRLTLSAAALRTVRGSD